MTESRAAKLRDGAVGRPSDGRWRCPATGPPRSAVVSRSGGGVPQ